MSNPPQVEIAFVAALEREVAGLARGRHIEELPVSDGVLKVYRIENAVLTCAGTGAARANLAAKKLLQHYSPKLLISIGFAGSCTNKITPGEIFIPSRVVESATSREFATICGEHTLVTLDRVAGSRLKQCSAARFDAQVVDMEAAGVAGQHHRRIVGPDQGPARAAGLQAGHLAADRARAGRPGSDGLAQ